MSPRYWVALSVFGTLAIGVGRIWASLLRRVRERREVESFIEVFNRYHQSAGRDLDAYGHLIERSYRVQNLLGPVGVMAHFVAPFRAYTAQNYEIIVNALPAMNRDWGDARNGYGQLVAETLVRYMGLSEDLIREKQRDFKNPIVWFREGVAGILFLPLQLLQSLGLVSESGSASIARSTLFRVLTGLVALIGLLASIVTIAQGWQVTLDAGDVPLTVEI